MKIGKQRLLVVGNRIKLKGESRTMQPCGTAAAIVFGPRTHGEVKVAYSDHLAVAGQQALWMYVICSRVGLLANEATTR